MVAMCPQVHALKQLVAAYPDAYYIHTRRNSRASIESFYRMLERYKLMGLLDRYKGQSPNLSLVDNAAIMLEAMQKTIASFFNRLEKETFFSFLPLVCRSY